MSGLHLRERGMTYGGILAYSGLTAKSELPTFTVSYWGGYSGVRYERTFGAIPGYPEGSYFGTRLELSQARLHRPLVAGISGSGHIGANSVVLAGGYEDTEDCGDTILYTGHGGRDPRLGVKSRTRR